MDIHIRWMIRRDIGDVMDVDDSSFSNPWTDDDWVAFNRKRNCISMVADIGDKIVGLMCYELHRTRIDLLKIAVHPAYRRQLVGDMLIAKLRAKLTKPRNKVCVLVDERNLDAQLFFKAMGFMATEIIKDERDSYFFELLKRERVTA